MIVDANMYWFPEEFFTDQEALEEFIELAPRIYDTNVYATQSDGIKQIIVEKPVGFPSVI